MKKKAEERLAELVHPAIDRIKHDIEDHQNGSVGATSARDILDRTGHKPTDKKEIVHRASGEVVLLTKILTLEELKDYRKRIRDAKAE